MSRHYSTEKGGEVILSPGECRWLYDEFWCLSEARSRAEPCRPQDAGEGCGKSCPYFEPEDLDGLEVWEE